MFSLVKHILGSLLDMDGSVSYDRSKETRLDLNGGMTNSSDILYRQSNGVFGEISAQTHTSFQFFVNGI